MKREQKHLNPFVTGHTGENTFFYKIGKKYNKNISNPDFIFLTDKAGYFFIECKEKELAVWCTKNVFGEKSTGLNYSQFKRYMDFYRKFKIPCLIIHRIKEMDNDYFMEWLHRLGRDKSKTHYLEKGKIITFPLSSYRKCNESELEDTFTLLLNGFIEVREAK